MDIEDIHMGGNPFGSTEVMAKRSPLTPHPRLPVKAGLVMPESKY